MICVIFGAGIDNVENESSYYSQHLCSLRNALVWRLTYWSGDTLYSHQLLIHVVCAAEISNCVLLNFIAVTLPSTGQTPTQQHLKQEILRDSQELKVGGEGNETHVCMAFVQ